MSIDKLKTVYSTGAFVNNVKTFFKKINEIIDWINNIGTPSYKVYTALLTQEGSLAPTVVVLENTIGSIVWTRSLAGQYSGTLSGAFTANKTYYRVTNNADGNFFLNSLLVNTNVIGLLSFDYTTGAYADDAMQQVPIEIRVYN